MDNEGATVVTESPDVHFNTHRNPSSGTLACIVTNAGRTPQKVTVTFDAAAEKGPVAIYEPFKEIRHATSPATLEIPGERFAVIVQS